MSDLDHRFRALLREDLMSFTRMAFKTIEPGTPFKSNWHYHALAYQLRRVAEGACRRLIVNVPPRSGKSNLASVAYPAWVLGRAPTKKIMCVSYGRELARKLAIDFRRVVDSDTYRKIFGEIGAERRRQRDTEIVTAAGGFRMAHSMGGSVHGQGADIIIIDDPSKPLEALSEAHRRHTNELYDGGLVSRLNDKVKGAIIIIMQRLHEDDLVGHVLGKDDWEVLSIPAIETEGKVYRLGSHPRDVYVRRIGEVLHPEREPREVLDSLRRQLGSLLFAAQYQQNPLPVEGNIIKREWLRYYDAPPTSFDLVVASWDTASTQGEDSDYSVCTIWGMKDASMYLLEVLRDKLEVPELRRLIIDTHQRYRVNCTLIEDSDIGRAIHQDLRRSTRVHPLMFDPRYDKQARLLAHSARFEAGDVLLPREAPWLAPYISELLAFPHGRHDDQVDSTSQALDYLWRRLSSVTPPVRPNPPRPPGVPRPAPKRAPGRSRRGNGVLPEP